MRPDRRKVWNRREGVIEQDAGDGRLARGLQTIGCEMQCASMTAIFDPSSELRLCRASALRR
jgi:hypothetical protein